MADILWHIGDLARGPRQFASGWYAGVAAAASPYSPVDGPDPDESAPIFEVGCSDPATDWPAVQPGPLDASHGWRPAQATVRFEAPAASEELWHELSLHALASHGPCPDLIVTVNGHRGLVLLEPSRDDRGHAPMPPSPISGSIDRTVPLRPGLIRAGRNEIVLTTHCQEEAEHTRDGVEGERHKTRPHLPHLGVWFGSALSWRGLALAAGTAPVAETLQLRPTPLYVRRDGALRELVDVHLHAPLGVGHGDVELRVGSETMRRPVEPVAFGDARIRFAVAAPDEAALDAARDAEVVLHLDRRRVVLPAAPLCPARRWTLHLIPHVHLDVGYTDNQAKVIELHNRNLGRVTDIVRQVPDYAFSVDGAMILETFLRSRTDVAADAAVAAIRSGQVGVNAFYALFLAGVASLEECYRAAYLSARLRHELGLPVDTANLTDVPSYPQSIPSIVAAAGLDGFFGIANHTRGGNADADTLHLQSPVRWRGPDGAEVLAFFSDSYSQLRFLCADPPTLAGMATSLPRFTARYERPDYAPHDLPIVGTHADNEDVADGYADLVRRWNDVYAYPRLRFSTMSSYLDSVRPVREQLPVLHGDGGSYWEDGVGTQAVAIARYRRTQTLLPSAETLSTLVAAHDPRVRPDVSALDEGWRRLLLGCEHTWTSAHATFRPHSPEVADQRDWKLGQIDEGFRIATDETRRALSQLAELIPTNGPALVVTNPASFARDVEVELELASDERIETTDGIPLPMASGPVRDGHRLAQVRIGTLPAFGYATFAVRRAAATDSGDLAPISSILDTPHYQVRLDQATGRVRGLHHLGLDRGVLDSAAAWALGEVLYVTGGGTAAGRGQGSEATSLNDVDPTLPPPALHIAAADLRAEGVRRLPWGWEISAVGSAPTLPQVRTTLRLYDDTARVEVQVTLTKQAELAKESVYVAFPFAVADPVVRYDRQQGWVDPVRDHQPGACNEWFTIQDAVTVSGAGLSVAWTSADAPLFTLGDVVRGRWPRAATPSGTILSWPMNNYWWTNTPSSQDGTLTLRYAFMPMPTHDPVAAWRLGRELRVPAPANLVTWLDKGEDGVLRPLAAAGQLFHADLPSHVDATVFSGRRHDGVVVRLRELAGIPAQASIRHPYAGEDRPGVSAHRCSAVEDRLEALKISQDGTVAVSLRPYEVITISMEDSR